VRRFPRTNFETVFGNGAEADRTDDYIPEEYQSFDGLG
jgi:hypothetical protein